MRLFALQFTTFYITKYGKIKTYPSLTPKHLTPTPALFWKRGLNMLCPFPAMAY